MCRKSDFIVVLSVSIIPRRIDQFSSDHWSQTTTGRVSTYMGDRLGIPCVLSTFYFFGQVRINLKGLLHHQKPFNPSKKLVKRPGPSKNRTTWRTLFHGESEIRWWVCLGSKSSNFTHPIFESDFDCLTGKHRILALLSPSPLASNNTKKPKI